MFTIVLNRLHIFLQTCFAAIKSIWKTSLSLKEEENLHRKKDCLNQLLTNVMTNVVRNEFHQYFSKDPNDLYLDLIRHKVPIEEWQNGIYKYLFNTGSINALEFDLTLLFYLYSNFSGASKPSNGWHNEPDINDISKEAEIVRIMQVRNKIIHPYLTNDDLEVLWNDLCKPAIALGCDSSEINIYDMKLPRLYRIQLLIRYIFTILFTVITFVLERLWISYNKWYHYQNGIKDIIHQVPMYYKRTNALNKIINEIQTKSKEQFGVVITGPGGVGKTQMAVAVLEKLKTEYKHVIWIEGEKDKLQKRFRALYTQMKLHLKDKLIDTKSDSAEEKHHLFDFLSHHKTLIIFDNVNNYEDIKNYLPTLESELSSITILITSQYQVWNKSLFSVYPIDVFNEEEAEDFIRLNWKPKKENREEGLLKELVMKLDYLPLALMQALSYLNNNPDYDLKEYLEEFDSNSQEVLEEIKDSTNYEKTVFTTSRTSIRKLSPRGKALLKLLSFMDNKHIQNKLLRNVLTVNITDVPNDIKEIIEAERPGVDKSFTELRKYSLINEKHSTDDAIVFSMHALTQSAVRNEKVFEDNENRNLDKYAIILVSILNKAIESEEEVVKQSIEDFNKEHFRYGEDWVWHLQEVLKICQRKHNHVIQKFTSLGKEENLKYAILSKGNYRTCYEVFKILLPHVPDKRSKIRIETTISYALLKMGKYMDAKGSFEKVLTDYSSIDYHPTVDELGFQIVGEDERNTAILDAEYYIGHCLMKQEDYINAIQMLEVVSEKIKQFYSENSRQYLLAQHDIAYSKFKLANYKEALDLFQNIIEKQENVCGKKNKSTLLTAHSIGHCLLELGRFEESKEYLQQTLQRKTEAFGKHHHETLITHHTLGLCLMKLKKHSEAKKILEEVFKIKKEALGPKNPSTLTTQHRLGNCMMEMSSNKKDYLKALALFEDVLKIRIEVLGRDKERTLMTNNDIGKCKMKMGMYDDAINIFTQIDEVQERLFSNKKLNTFTTKYNLAECYIMKKKFEEAKKLLLLVEKAQVLHYGDNHDEVRKTRAKIDECENYQVDTFEDKKVK